jgi:hypothetical protein
LAYLFNRIIVISNVDVSFLILERGSHPAAFAAPLSGGGETFLSTSHLIWEREAPAAALPRPDSEILVETRIK